MSLQIKNLAFVAAFGLLLAACGQGTAPDQPPPLEGAALGGDFTLTGETGAPVSWSDFDGKYRTIYFGYTFCPDACPVDNGRAMAGLKTFAEQSPERAAKIQPLFVSVDPERDTPAVLREFTDQFHPELIGMTGEKENLDRIIADYGGVYRIGERNAAGGYLVDHPKITFLYGPEGEPIAMLPTDQGPDAVAAELDKWVR